jgi:hypothetical protein
VVAATDRPAGGLREKRNLILKIDWSMRIPPALSKSVFAGRLKSERFGSGRIGERENRCL